MGGRSFRPLDVKRMLAECLIMNRINCHTWNLLGSARIKLGIQPIDQGLKRRESSRT